MRLSRLGTDTSTQHDYQGFRGRVRVGPIDPCGGSAEQLPAHQPIGVVRTVIQGAATPGESGGATRAALLAMRAHREPEVRIHFPPAESLVRTAVQRD